MYIYWDICILNSVTAKETKKQEKRVKKGKKKDSEISDHSGQTQIMDDGFRRRTAVWGWSTTDYQYEDPKKDKEWKRLIKERVKKRE